ncbi:MAG: hypothetical protein H7641_07190, partial [Candidatus Heimdallarchaeota archaeon]|nr:hypothetical protein [Candidatus Heimdallarchaeota archaeon]MCK4877349.1 hypothetical protein [Candidatus Heimdallarchaeota archaeon]
EYGTITQTIDFPSGVENPKIEFDAIGMSATFEVLVRDLADNKLAELENKISGPKQLSSNYETKSDRWVITSDDDGNYSVHYERQPETQLYRYRHEIQIIVDYQALSSFELSTNVGEISFTSEEKSVNLSIPKLVTLGGDVQVDILGANSTIETDEIESLDGNVRIFLAENTTVKGNLALSAFNGVVSLNCSDGTYLDLEGLFIQTNNGNSGVKFDNIRVSLDFNFTIVLVVGSLNMTWNQESFTSDSQFYISVNSGNVDVLLDFHPDIGTMFETEIVSGEEDVPSDTTGTGGMGEISFFINTYSGNVNVTRI